MITVTQQEKILRDQFEDLLPELLDDIEAHLRGVSLPKLLQKTRDQFEDDVQKLLQKAEQKLRDQFEADLPEFLDSTKNEDGLHPYLTVTMPTRSGR